MADKTSVLRGPKSMLVKSRTIARTMTAGTALATLPKGARIIGFMLNGVASDAATTATLGLGTTSAAANLVTGYDVKTVANGRGTVLLPTVSNALTAVLLVDTVIYAIYAETGTASTVGGWTVSILYTPGNITNDDTF